jgi:hypothetical protein
VINKLVVLHNIQLVLVTDVGDAGDETFLVRTNSAQDFALN